MAYVKTEDLVPPGLDIISDAFKILGPKFSEPRQIQRQLLEQMTEEVGANFYMVEAPTGIGKSPLGVALGDMIGVAGQTMVLTATISLQEQYRRDFDQLVVVKGRGNYPCTENGLTADMGVCQRTKNFQCDSQFYIDRADALLSPRVASNYALYLSELYYTDRGYKESRKPGLLVCDEAHKLLDVLTQFETVRLDAEIAARLGFKVLGWSGLEAAQEWCKEHRGAVEQGYMDALEGRSRGARRWRTLLRQMEGVRTLNPEDPNLLTLKAGPALEISPLWPEKSAARLFGSAHNVLLMSATLYGGHVLARLLGKDSGYSYHTAPSPFPRERWPVYYKPVAKMSKAGGDAVWAKMSEAVHEYVHARHQEKGVIHVSAANQVDRVLQTIRGCQDCNHRVAFPTAGRSRADVIGDYRRGPPGTWLCHYSVGEGESFDDDSTRVQLIAKIPYPDLGDKLTRLRRDEPGLGSKMYAAVTAGKLAQTAGRGMRHDRDYCETYILDGSFWNLFKWHRELFPEWFSNLIVWR